MEPINVKDLLRDYPEMTDKIMDSRDRPVTLDLAEYRGTGLYLAHKDQFYKFPLIDDEYYIIIPLWDLYEKGCLTKDVIDVAATASGIYTIQINRHVTVGYYLDKYYLLDERQAAAPAWTEDPWVELPDNVNSTISYTDCTVDLLKSGIPLITYGDQTLKITADKVMLDDLLFEIY